MNDLEKQICITIRDNRKGCTCDAVLKKDDSLEACQLVKDLRKRFNEELILEEIRGNIKRIEKEKSQ